MERSWALWPDLTSIDMIIVNFKNIGKLRLKYYGEYMRFHLNTQVSGVNLFTTSILETI